MSRLYFTEEGMVIPTLCEELNTFRRARKTLRLPSTHHPAVLYVSAYAYPGSSSPLRVAVNGTELAPLSPSPLSMFHWYEMSIPAAVLKEGENRFDLWTDSTAMNAWGLAMEGGHQDPSSQLSSDAGRTWRNHHMGYLNATRGEYLVRLRLAEGQDPQPPAWVAEQPGNEALQALRRLLPAAALQDRPALERIRTLSTWISTSWEYRASNLAAQYAPWDIETILAWGKARQGHNSQLPIVMCVHYGVAFVSACQAAGLTARTCVFTEAINGPNGHFTAEVWVPEYQKWVFVDANADALFFKDGLPLSVDEVRSLRPNLGAYIAWGPGLQFQLPNPVMKDFVANYNAARFMNHRSIWWRADFLANPQYSPPGHGSLCYCETGLIWEQKDLLEGLGMFPGFGNAEYFNAAPR